MKHITLSKINGERYTPHTPKHYEVTSPVGETLGYVEQDVSLSKWHVQDRYGLPLASHTTIKAAVRVANKVLA